MSGLAPMQRDAARLEAIAADPTQVTSDKGEILLLPPELWQAVDAATAAAAEHDDTLDARATFGAEFARALHARGLILVPRARSNSRETVSADTYSLALAGKHLAERELHCLRQLLLGWEAMPGFLLETFGEAVLALAGRAPPAGKAQLEQVALRLRAATAIALKVGDVGKIPPFIPPLAELLDELRGQPDPGQGEAIR